jgi:hypothetical protein
MRYINKLGLIFFLVASFAIDRNPDNWLKVLLGIIFIAGILMFLWEKPEAE